MTVAMNRDLNNLVIAFSCENEMSRLFREPREHISILGDLVFGNIQLHSQERLIGIDSRGIDDALLSKSLFYLTKGAVR